MIGVILLVLLGADGGVRAWPFFQIMFSILLSSKPYGLLVDHSSHDMTKELCFLHRQVLKKVPET